MIYERLKDFTMVPEVTFNANLALAKKVRDVPGCVVECGVWKGGMIAGIASVLGDRVYYLFDSFEGLPQAQDIDGPEALKWQAETDHNCRAGPESAWRAMSIAGARDYYTSCGWFADTVPVLNPGSIALLRLDCDWYASVRLCLEHLAPKVAKGGIIIIDDYFAWEGCRKAVHEYFTPADLNFDDATHLCWVVK